MPVSNSKIGIIYPPPEVRSIVDKTAAFVARNGPEFEEKIRQNEINNVKFNFLSNNDPYHAYYQHKVREIAEGKDQSAASTTTTQPPDTQNQTLLPSKIIFYINFELKKLQFFSNLKR
jgi:splicing factor 3A subunit 1